jgi:hypothetical protein
MDDKVHGWMGKLVDLERQQAEGVEGRQVED